MAKKVRRTFYLAPKTDWVAIAEAELKRCGAIQIVFTGADPVPRAQIYAAAGGNQVTIHDREVLLLAKPIRTSRGKTLVRTDTKRCPKCGLTLPLSFFNFKRTAKDSHQSYCRDCSRAYSKSWRQQS